MANIHINHDIIDHRLCIARSSKIEATSDCRVSSVINLWNPCKHKGNRYENMHLECKDSIPDRKSSQWHSWNKKTEEGNWEWVEVRWPRSGQCYVAE